MQPSPPDSTLMEKLVRLEVAAEYRHQAILWHLHEIHAHVHPDTANRSWLKVPIALVLPIAIFLLMLALTGDLRSALKVAKIAG